MNVLIRNYTDTDFKPLWQELETNTPYGYYHHPIKKSIYSCLFNLNIDVLMVVLDDFPTRFLEDIKVAQSIPGSISIVFLCTSSIVEKLDEDTTLLDNYYCPFPPSLETLSSILKTVSINRFKNKVATEKHLENQRLLTRLKAIIEHSPEIISYKEAGNAHPEYINKSGLQFLGISPKESLTNYATAAFHPPWVQTLLKRDADPIAKEKGFWRGETALLDKDGNEVPMFQLILTIYEEETQKLIYATILKDLSSIRKIEEVQNRLMSIIEASPNLVAYTDSDLIFKYINPAGKELLGYKPDQQINQIFLADIHPEKIINTTLQQAILLSQFKGLWKGESIVQKTTGEEIPVEQIVIYLKNPKGEHYFAVIMSDLRDIKSTQLKLKELNESLENQVIERTQKLEKANQELQQFAYMVSHDLKAPLRGINQLSEWIIEDHHEELNESGKQQLALLQNRVAKMNELLDGILTYSRLGSTHIDRIPTDLNEIIFQTIETLNPPSSIQLHVMPDFPILNKDPIRLKQVFQNLLDNAIRHVSPETGEVFIRHQRKPDGWEVSIEDNGPGIDEKYHEKIFKIFHSLSDDHTGIGLSIIKRIVEQDGGRVWVKSEVGKGATFYIYWPDELPDDHLY